MKNKVVCIGSLMVDELFFCESNVLIHTSNPAKCQRFIGGVMANISQHLALLDFEVEYITAFGNDSDADWLKKVLLSKNVNLNHSVYTDGSSGKYTSIINHDGSLFAAVCVDICESSLKVDHLVASTKTLENANLILIDTNVDVSLIEWIIDFCKKQNKKLVIEPVSIPKASKLKDLSLDGIFMITPNLDELYALDSGKVENEIVKNILNRGLKNLWIRKGSKGSSMYSFEEINELPAQQIKVNDSTGAGDSALAAWVYGYLNNYSIKNTMQISHSLAYEVLQIKGAVLETLSPEKLKSITKKYYPNEF